VNNKKPRALECGDIVRVKKQYSWLQGRSNTQGRVTGVTGLRGEAPVTIDVDFGDTWNRFARECLVFVRRA